MRVEGWCRLIPILMLALLSTGCRRTPVLDSLDDAHFTFVASDGSTVTLPDDTRGKVVLLGYVYTHCPDICPMTTANMRTVREQLGAPDDVRFVTVTFDPARDTPEVMQRYRKVWGVDQTPWLFLTGDSATVASFMDRMKVRREVAYSTTMEDGEPVYFINHTDQVTLLDRKGRVVRHYGGSMTPPEILVEDINALR